MIDDFGKRVFVPETLTRPTELVSDDSALQPLVAGRTKIIYCHGIKNKPPEDELLCQWDTALRGSAHTDSKMVYWVDRARYPTPVPETCQDVDKTNGVNLDGERLLADAGAPLDATPEELAWLAAVEDAMLTGPQAIESLFWGPIDRAALRLFTRAFMPDAYGYFFKQDIRDRIERQFVQRLRAAGGPVVVIGHSLGSVIAYEALRKFNFDKAEVPLFVTIGSPLGIGPIQAAMKVWSGNERPYPRPPCVERWINIKAKGDPIASNLDSDFGEPDGDVEEIGIKNIHRDAHASDGYLRVKLLQDAVTSILKEI